MNSISSNIITYNLQCYFQNTSLKMKEKLRKFGRATRNFIQCKLMRKEPLIRRCEINIEGFDDRCERLILLASTAGKGGERAHVFLPSFLETERITLPKSMLPKKGGDRLTVYVYGVANQKSRDLPDFCQVLISGVCSLQAGELIEMNE